MPGIRSCRNSSGKEPGRWRTGRRGAGPVKTRDGEAPDYLYCPGDVAVFPAWVPHNLTALEDSVWFESHGAGF